MNGSSDPGRDALDVADLDEITLDPEGDAEREDALGADEVLVFTVGLYWHTGRVLIEDMFENGDLITRCRKLTAASGWVTLASIDGSSVALSAA